MEERLECSLRDFQFGGSLRVLGGRNVNVFKTNLYDVERVRVGTSLYSVSENLFKYEITKNFGLVSALYFERIV